MVLSLPDLPDAPPRELFANFAKTTLKYGVGAGDALLVPSDAARFPIIRFAGGNCYRLVLANADETEWEVCVCVRFDIDIGADGQPIGADTAFRVQRGQEGTEARDWPAGTKLELRLTAGALNAIADLGVSSMDFDPLSRRLVVTRPSGETFDVHIPK
jgi:hypothetical protein